MTDGDGIRALVISDPAQPADFGRLALPFGVTEMVAVGDMVYLLTSDGVWGFNVSDSSRPYLSGHLQLPGYDYVSNCSNCNLSVDGDWLYVALDQAGLFVVQVEYQIDLSTTRRTLSTD